MNDETLNQTFTYSYNSRGNMTSKSIYPYTTADPISGTPTSTDTYAYGDSNWPDKLTSYDGQAITSDEIGNPLSYKGYTMTWTAGRLLDSMIGNSKSLYFKYGEDGNRTQKTVGTTVTRYTTIDGRITSQNDGTNILQFHYDHNNELAGAMINGTEYVYAKNLQGDIVSLVDTAGNIVVNYSYDAWGKVQSITGSLASTIGQLNPMRYRGYYQDTETGLYYLQSRYYDPDTCRMLNADKYDQINETNSSIQDNLYNYCQNSPIENTDATGTSSWKFVGFGVQIEISYSNYAIGAEIVWFNSNVKTSRSWWDPILYVYGAGGLNADLKSVIKGAISDPMDLVNPVKLRSGVGVSICGFFITAKCGTGKEDFNDPNDFQKYFSYGSITINHWKAYTEWNKIVFIVGGGVSTSYYKCSSGGTWSVKIGYVFSGISSIYNKSKSIASKANAH